ncbi:MAG: acetyltransferase [Rhodopirellula sp. JB055]|uniref:acetyltransferase n=1 Tax=Rhodopirellula sp. JB055 TaxID=3342846 RepID=UPI00370B3ADE
MRISTADVDDYSRLIEIWELSVRATHDFLPEEEILALRPLILDQYFDAVELTCARDEADEICGFCGVSDGNIEMLFVAPQARGTGVGRALTEHAVRWQSAMRVDVNEQNVQAIGFYQRMGFAIVGRSPVDGQGKPYPLLHMQLNSLNPSAEG